MTQPVVIVTGASSDVGLPAIAVLVGRCSHGVMACWGPPRAAAAGLGIAGNAFSLSQVDLRSLASGLAFAGAVRATGLPLDACSATRLCTSHG